MLLALLLSILTVTQSLANDAPLVAAASSLRQVWPLLMQAYSPATQPRVTFGSSGNLSRQIIQSAPFELFLSADLAYPEQLYARGISIDKPEPYTNGALAWVALEGTALAQWLNGTTTKPIEANPFSTATELQEVNPFSSTHTVKLAVANPAFAPYGRAAKQALDATTGNSTRTLKFTLGENAAQALQFALSGATDGGIVPLSLVSGVALEQLPPIVVGEISATLHQPLTHSMVLINKSSFSSQSLYKFLLSEPAQSIFKRNGFRAIN